MEKYTGDNRRKEYILSDSDLNFIVETVIDKLETKANRLGFKALIALAGIFLTLLGAWLSNKIHFKIDP